MISINYYISDLHIGCVNKFDNRTLDDDERLVKNWNERVCNNDNVYILGDIARLGSNKDNEYACSVISRLKAKKILVVGNHDVKGIKDNRVAQLFTEICNYKEITDNYNGMNHNLVLCHYPIFSWNGCYKNTILLYGHTHGNFDDKIYQQSLEILRKEVQSISELEDNVKFKQKPYAYNVGAMLEYMDYTPRTLKEIMEGDNKV